MYHAQVFALEYQRQLPDEAQQAFAFRGVDAGIRFELVLFWINVIPEPVVAVLAISAQQIQFMIAHDGLRLVVFHQASHQSYYAGTIRSAIAEIAYEYETSALWVMASVVVAKVM